RLRVIVQDERDADRLRHGLVVGVEGRVVLWRYRRHEHRSGSELLGFSRLLDGPSRAEGAHTDPHREPPGRLLDHCLDHQSPLAPGQLVRFAEEPEDGDAVDTSGDLEVDEPPQTGYVDLARVGERGRDDGVDAAKRGRSWVRSGQRVRVNVTLPTGTNPASETVPINWSPTKVPSKFRAFELLRRLRWSSSPKRPLRSTRLGDWSLKIPTSYCNVARAVTSCSRWLKVRARSTGSRMVVTLPGRTSTSKRADHVCPSMNRSPGIPMGTQDARVSANTAAARISFERRGMAAL